MILFTAIIETIISYFHQNQLPIYDINLAAIVLIVSEAVGIGEELV